MANSRSRYLTAAPQDDRYQARYGNGLTPELITGVLRNAELGYMDRLADLLDEVRQLDAHLQGELFKRERAVSGAPYKVVPHGTTAKAKAAAAYCRELLESFEVPQASQALTFRAALSHLVGGGVWHGRAAIEVIWARDGRALRPTRLEWIHPRRLAYAAQSWKLHLWDAGGGTIGSPFSAFPGVPVDDPVLFPDGKLIVHTPRIFGTYPTREGLGRVLVWYSAFKRWTLRDWLAFAEWAGRGLRVGKYQTGRDPKNPGAQATDDDVEVLRDALEAMSSSVSTVIPDVTDLAVHPPPTNGEVHERLVLLCNGEQSKAILGGTLTSDPGERGARSLGNVHDDVRLQIAGGDAEAVAGDIRRDLFGPAVRERFGDRCPVPFLAITTEPRESLDSFATRVKLMADAGLPMPAAFVRQTLGIPDPTGAEEVIGAAPEPDADETDQAPPDGETPTPKPPKGGKEPAKKPPKGGDE